MNQPTPTTGPRGGRTTVTTSGMIRKNLWISHEENEALRLRAFEERQSETSIIRSGLRKVLALAALVLAFAVPAAADGAAAGRCWRSEWAGPCWVLCEETETRCGGSGLCQRVTILSAENVCRGDRNAERREVRSELAERPASARPSSSRCE